MRQFIIGFAALLSISVATAATADLETLAPESARDVVAKADGVMIVDLFAEW